MSQERDMESVRGRTTINVVEVTHFIYSESHSGSLTQAHSSILNTKTDGKSEWDSHQKLVQILSNDAVFDKGKR